MLLSFLFVGCRAGGRQVPDAGPGDGPTIALDSVSASRDTTPITPPRGDAGMQPIEAGNMEAADGGVDGSAVLPLSGCGSALGYEARSPWPVQGGCERRNWRT